ncbi:MAG: GlsB/YeaQ/YmgE family stress response membrane protein [Hyphomicrobiales bacterium]|nr:GlsB/YeaQ/YmgE family stress response membrane protein [Hyphomicrobiales bacterium]
MNAQQLLVTAVIGIVAGWLATFVVGTVKGGLVGLLIAGLVGSVVGSFLLNAAGVKIGLGHPVANNIVQSAIGAAVVILVARLFL